MSHALGLLQPARSIVMMPSLQQVLYLSLCLAVLRAASCASGSRTRFAQSGSHLLVWQGEGYHCNRCCASVWCPVGLRPTRYAGVSSRCFASSCSRLSARQGCHHCGRHCASACCLAGVRPARCAKASSRGFVEFWQKALSRTREPTLQLESILDCLRDLAASSQPDAKAINAAGALPPLVALLQPDQPAMQMFRAKVLGHPARGSQQNRSATAPAAVSVLVPISA